MKAQAQPAFQVATFLVAAAAAAAFAHAAAAGSLSELCRHRQVCCTDAYDTYSRT